ncbi:hypothetical protein JCM5350_005917 [Sporobolomyces pararoseus]
MSQAPSISTEPAYSISSSRRPLANVSLFPPSIQSNPTSSNGSTSKTTRKQPRKSVIKLRAEEWGSLATKVSSSSMEEEREREGGRKRGPPPVYSPQRFTHGNDVQEEEEHNRLCMQAGKEETVKRFNLDKRSPSRSPRPSPSLSQTSPRMSSIAPTSRHHKPQAAVSLPSSSSAGPLKFPSDPPSRPYWETFKAIQTALTSPLKVLQADVSIRDYDDFLSPSTTVEPHSSLDLLELQVEFFKTIQHPQVWAKRPDSALYKSLGLPYPNEELLATRLDIEKIRRIYPLKRSKWDFRFHVEDLKNFPALRGTLEWMYGLHLERKEMLSFLENAPLPLLILARLHADKARHTKAVEYSALELQSYLQSTRSNELDPMQKRGKDLFIWLTRADDGVRSRRWQNFWVEEVERKREGKRSLVDRWMEADGGWIGIESLSQWEETKLA